MENEFDLRCPCIKIEKEESLGVHLQSFREVAASDVVQVFWIDFTIPGYNFNRSAWVALSKMADCMAANPEKKLASP